MKNLIFAIVSIVFAMVSTSCMIPVQRTGGYPQIRGPIRTFSGKKVDWSCSGTTENGHVMAFLQKNWKEGRQLSLQEKANKEGLNVEFLWKVGQSSVKEALDSGSSFLTDQKPDKVEMVYSPNGRVEITLYFQGSICGRVRGWTSATRGGGQYSQLSPGTYKVTGYNPKGYSKTFKVPMLNQTTLSGTASERGISIHTGDTSGEDTYHGCVRVGQLVGQKFGQLLERGTTVVVKHI